MRKLCALLVVTASALLPVAGAAAQDENGYQAIAAGDYSAAEQAIQHERRLFPNDADLLANLAAIYARTGRVAAARTLYSQMLAQPDESLRQAEARTVSAHVLAREGLSRLPLTQVAAR